MRKIPKVIVDSIDNSITLSSTGQKCSLIWLHGLGDKASGFLSFFTHSHSPLYQGIRIKLIQAPIRSFTLNQGQKTNAWYDMRSLNRFTNDQSKVFNLQDLQESCQTIEKHVNQEVKFWQQNDQKSIVNPYHRVFVGGFSQGAVTALHYGMTAKNIPAGVIGLSGYLLKSTALTNCRKFPISLMHGQNDQIIKQIQAKKSYQNILGESGIIQYQNLKDLGHTVNLSQLTLMNNWFQQVNQMIDVHYKKEPTSSSSSV